MYAQGQPVSHQCQRNWTRPSSPMETDIVIEGFNIAELKYRLRYTKFVGDGDSSVYHNLITGVQGYGHAIRKI